MPEQAKPEDWLASEEGRKVMANLQSDSPSAERPKEQPKAATGGPDQTPAPKTVRLKTPEGEFDVPEAIAKGYWRQDDYTRKTQELSKERQDLRSKRFSLEAFQANPDEWIRLNRPELLKTEKQPDPEPEPKDPGEKALKRVEAVEHERNVDRALQTVENELAYLSRAYPDLYNRAEILTFAEKNGYESTIQAFRDLNFDRAMERRAAAPAREKARADLSGATGIVAEPADNSTAALTPKAPPKTDAEANAAMQEFVKTHPMWIN